MKISELKNLISNFGDELDILIEVAEHGNGDILLSNMKFHELCYHKNILSLSLKKCEIIDKDFEKQ